MNFKLLLSFLLLVGLFSACKKETIPQNLASETKMLWVTPSGIAIPYEESHRWEEYVAEKIPQTKDVPKKKYESFNCTTAEGKCGLMCQESTFSSCTSAFPCTLCINCCVTE